VEAAALHLVTPDLIGVQSRITRLRKFRRAKGANQFTRVSFLKRSAFDPFTFEEIGFAFRELANLGRAFAVSAIKGERDLIHCPSE
jgi:hypothetical protein